MIIDSSDYSLTSGDGSTLDVYFDKQSQEVIIKGKRENIDEIKDFI